MHTIYQIVCFFQTIFGDTLSEFFYLDALSKAAGLKCPATKKGEQMGFEGGDREMHDAVCAKCGQSCQVPFKPTEGRPVYCRNCYTPKPRF